MRSRPGLLVWGLLVWGLLVWGLLVWGLLAWGLLAWGLLAWGWSRVRLACGGRVLSFLEGRGRQACLEGGALPLQGW